jgi:Cdc6-like AAA superfamily ATPase
MSIESESGGTALIASDELASVVSKFIDQADDVPDERLVASYVGRGIEGKLDNENAQVVYGRRGTGKTHLLKVYAREIARSGSSRAAIYVDLKRTTDSELVADLARPDDVPAHMIHILSSLRNQLEREIGSHRGRDGAADALAQLDALIGQVKMRDLSVTAGDSTKKVADEAAELNVTASANPRISAKLGSGGTEEQQSHVKTSGRGVDYVNFTQLSSRLRTLLDAADLDRVVLVLDEWSSIDPRIQPDLADFLTRALPSDRFTLKFGAIQHRSQFMRSLEQGRHIGLDRRHDLATPIDLDDVVVFDEANARAVDVFSDMLFRHIALTAAMAKLDERSQRGFSKRLVKALFGHGDDQVLADLVNLVDRDYWGAEFTDQVGRRLMRERFENDGDVALAAAVFASDPVPALQELILASGGIVRDFLKVFVLAFDIARRDGSAHITAAAVREAAEDWYENTKVPALTTEQQDWLEYIVGSTLVTKGSRFFAVGAGSKPWAQRADALFDQGVVHCVARGRIDPGQHRRSALYMLDFATYARQLRDDETPEQHFAEVASAKVRPATLRNRSVQTHFLDDA